MEIADSVDVAVRPENDNGDHLALGRLGEALAAEFLEGSGFSLVAANFSVPVGRGLHERLIFTEIDLIAYEDSTLCFIEVKTRRSDWFATPETNVDLRKQRQITRAATAYLRIFGLTESSYRFDVVSVIVPELDFKLAHPNVTILRNFWTSDKFAKLQSKNTFQEFND